MPKPNTRDTILATAHDLLASDGISGVSFDAIARRLGRSKQAVLYWFPSKHDLLSAMFVPWLEAEAEAAAAALDGTPGREAAIAAFVRAVTEFHCRDLARFRMMYLVPQTMRGQPERDAGSLVDRVHPVTDRLYAGLARHLDPAGADAARREAVAIHAAVLGLVLMLSLADALRDPLKHSREDLVAALIAALTVR